VPKERLLRRPGELERAIELVGARVGSQGAIFIVLDADDDCPAIVGPELLRRVPGRSPLPTSVVFAKREFEAWFLAAAASLRGLRGLPANLEPPAAPEEVRGAKERLTARMPPHGHAPTVDQPAFAARFDIDAARKLSSSFDKFCRDVERLLRCGKEGDA
jgi:hypothetical protein